LLTGVNGCYLHFMYHYCELPAVNFSSIIDYWEPLQVAFELFLSRRRVSGDQNVPIEQSSGCDHFAPDGAVLHLVYVLYHLGDGTVAIRSQALRARNHQFPGQTRRNLALLRQPLPPCETLV